MKRVLIVSAVSLFIALRCQSPLAGRFVLSHVGPEPYASIAFTNQDRGWVASWPLLHTNDGAGKWVERTESASDMDFISDTTGWLVQYGGDGSTRVGVTTDGGRSCSWHEVDGALLAISAVSMREAWALGFLNGGHRTGSAKGASTAAPGPTQIQLLHTLNGGRTWYPKPLPVGKHFSAQFFGLEFRNRLQGWIVGVEIHGPLDAKGAESVLAIWRTEDAGNTFRKATLTPLGSHGDHPWQVHFVNEREGWIAIGAPSLLHTLDGGETWSLVNPLGEITEMWRVDLTDCCFPTSEVGWAVGTRWLMGTLTTPPRLHALALQTRDGGKTWREVETDVAGMPNSGLSRVAAVDEEHAWAIGGGGNPAGDMGPLTLSPSYERWFILKYLPQRRDPREGR